MAENKQEIFENASISKAIWSLALPTIIGMLVMAFYNIVDTYFIGQTRSYSSSSSITINANIYVINGIW